MTLNRYNYCVSSYLNYQDPSGNIPLETALDAVSLGDSLKNAIEDTSLENLAFLVWDGAALFLPYVSASYILKGGKAVRKFFKAGKIVDNVPGSAAREIVQEALEETAEHAIKDDTLVKEGIENVVEAAADTAKKVDVPASAIDNVDTASKTAVKEGMESAADAKAISNACEGGSKAVPNRYGKKTNFSYEGILYM